jgi:hypothetical protein
MDIVQNLITSYAKILSASKPFWAQRMMNQTDIIPPTIPFVGEKYQKSKVLIYASAENLSHYNGHLEDQQIKINDQGQIVENRVEMNNRHRYYFNCEQNKNRFYPNVHCAPMNDGSLTLASAYLCQKIGIKINYKTPKKFLEHISFANFGKFSIHLDDNSKRNIDYASQVKYLCDSFDYVTEDLMQLSPEYIVIPKSIYEQDDVRQLIHKYAPRAKCFPIYQINVGNINRMIHMQYPKKDLNELEPCLQEWYGHLEWSGKSKENYLSVFTYLDEVLK